MRVVQVGKYYYPYMGGIESHLYTLSNELKGKVDLDVVVSNDSVRTTRDVVRGVAVTRCASLTEVASTAISPGMALELSQREYDVVHLHLPHPVGTASYLASRKPKHHRLIVTYHSDVVRQQRLMSFYRPLVDRLLARADAVLATSPNYIESSEVLQRFSGKCHVVPYGIDVELFADTDEVRRQAAHLRASYGGGPLLIAVGRLIYYKGFEYALRALQHARAAQLIIVGDGPLRPALDALARELGVAERVHFIGNVHNDSIAPYYYASDVYLLPSIARSEAFGIVQLEAMACGLPVINTSLASGVPFVSRHGETGLTVPPADSQALAVAINELIANDEQRRAFGTAGRVRVQTEFAKEILAERVLSLYGLA